MCHGHALKLHMKPESGDFEIWNPLFWWSIFQIFCKGIRHQKTKFCDCILVDGASVRQYETYTEISRGPFTVHESPLVITRGKGNRLCAREDVEDL